MVIYPSEFYMIGTGPGNNEPPRRRDSGVLKT